MFFPLVTEGAPLTQLKQWFSCYEARRCQTSRVTQKWTRGHTTLGTRQLWVSQDIFAVFATDLEANQWCSEADPRWQWTGHRCGQTAVVDRIFVIHHSVAWHPKRPSLLFHMRCLSPSRKYDHSTCHTRIIHKMSLLDDVTKPQF